MNNSMGRPSNTAVLFGLNKLHTTLNFARFFVVSKVERGTLATTSLHPSTFKTTLSGKSCDKAEDLSSARKKAF